MTRAITIALLAALHAEMTPTLRRLGMARMPQGDAPIAAGARGRARIHAHVTGMGKANAQHGVDRMLADARPDAVILLGFAGALRPGLDIADVLEPTACVHPDDAASRSTPTDVSTLLTVDRPVLDPAEKSRLYDAMNHPDAVDMETYHVLRKLDEAGVPCRVIRAITDRHDQKLEPEVAHWIDAHGRPRPSRVMRDIARRPALIAHAWTLRRAARLAGAAVAERVERRLDELIVELAREHEA